MSNLEGEASPDWTRLGQAKDQALGLELETNQVMVCSMSDVPRLTCCFLKLNANAGSPYAFCCNCIEPASVGFDLQIKINNR